MNLSAVRYAMLKAPVATGGLDLTVKRSEDLTPHCLTLIVTNRVAVPRG